MLNSSNHNSSKSTQKPSVFILSVATDLTPQELMEKVEPMAMDCQDDSTRLHIWGGWPVVAARHQQASSAMNASHNSAFPASYLTRSNSHELPSVKICMHHWK